MATLVSNTLIAAGSTRNRVWIVLLGSGTFGFMLSAIDGQVSGGGGVDRFRMKIWTILSDGAEGSVIYDNQMGGGVDVAPTTALGGGSINIQSK